MTNNPICVTMWYSNPLGKVRTTSDPSTKPAGSRQKLLCRHDPSPLFQACFHPMTHTGFFVMPKRYPCQLGNLRIPCTLMMCQPGQAFPGMMSGTSVKYSSACQAIPGIYDLTAKSYVEGGLNPLLLSG